MELSAYLPLLLLLFLVLYEQRQSKEALLKQLIMRKNGKERTEMLELAKRFIGQECLVYTFNSQINGTIKEVTDGALLLEGADSTEAVNLDFVVRIREVPKKKNGKKKTLVLD